MGEKRSGGEHLNFEICVKVFVCLVLLFAARFSLGIANPNDVAAINSLYSSLGSPVLPGWVASGGDPCAEAWQGVLCNVSDIMSIVLNGANLRGELGNDLGMFTSIKSIDLSNNHIGGSIPSNLPVTLQNFFLSANNFTGPIPDSLSTLTLLTDMSLNNNFLSGEIPDAFQSLTGLINLDLSNNNLSGQLPSSFSGLSSVVTLHLEDNQLSGTLNVLQDLPLRDLNIENNLFSGPIPEKLLSIPNFRQDGNPFNLSAAPLPSPISPSTTLAAPPVSQVPPSSASGKTPTKRADGPASTEESKSGGRKFLTTKSAVWISIAGVLLFVIIALALLLFLPSCVRRREEAGRIFRRHQVGAYKGNRDNTRDDRPVLPTNQIEKVSKETAVAGTQAKEEYPKPENAYERNVPQRENMRKRDDYEIDMGRVDMVYMAPPPPPPPPLLPPPSPPPPPPPVVGDFVVKPVPTEGSTREPLAKNHNLITSARSFTIASLQQYTNSFSQENLVGGGMLGTVYRAQLPNGKLLAVKKLDKKVSDQQKDNEFLELVNDIDRIRHPNVVELMGHCAEHGQKLLVYEYCSTGTLHDALHSDDELKRKLSWTTRIQMALGAARALEYLHEVCQPPIVHRNFKSANVLLDDDFAVHVSDCGLAPLISSGSVNQLSGHLLTAFVYGAPEFESGIYTIQSDVYSFGVVMLELLTGRKSFDSTRNRVEQYLVRWAVPQLHDIDKLSRMVDPSLNGEYSGKSLSHFADIISRCVQSEPEFRPPMSEVVQDLTNMLRRDRHSNESIGY